MKDEICALYQIIYEDFIAEKKGGSAAYLREIERDHHLHDLHAQAKAHG